MSARGEISLGDLYRAVTGLRPADAGTVAAMAGLLGLAEEVCPARDDRPAPRRPDPSPLLPPPPTLPPPPPRALVTPERVPWPEPRATSVPESHGPAVRFAERAPRFSLTPVDGLLTRTVSAPGGTAGPTPEPLLRPVVTTALPHEPPWKREWARGVMVAALSIPVESREFDQRELLRRVARQDALRSVPRRSRLTTRLGAQLLLDHGPAMAPFQDDRAWVRELAASVAGRDRLDVLRFRGTPGRGVVRRDPLDRGPYRAPQPGTPVVLFSDLGRTRHPLPDRWAPRPGEWTAFLDGVTRAGCPVICVTPYPGTDYPAALRRTVAFVPLDRSLSLRHAHAIVDRTRRTRERG
ncbi:hypothetical protein ABT354_17345 [Streptomyces sp. NPDC000594]|uniref:hypothetical protein n=1 Tax=Streptomyces sp. NPDC000594 TaxID=3154261 RepID=UPI003331A16A